MRTQTVGVTQVLLESAKKEFLQYGFEKASLRRISAVSGVSTNSIYTRFQDKAGLFRAVVKEVADGLLLLYESSIKEAAACNDVGTATNAGDEGTKLVLSYIYEHIEECKLLFCGAAGTEYESFFDRLAAMEESYYKEMVAQFASKGSKVDDFFIHVVCRNGWQYIYELLTHDKSYEEAVQYMEDVRVFQYAGWQAVLHYDGQER